MLQAVCATLADVCLCLNDTSFNKFAFPNAILYGWMFASVCHALFLVCSICLCRLGSCLLLLKGYQFTQKRNFIFQFKMVAGCFWLLLNVVSMIQAVCVTLAAVCWCLRIATLHTSFFKFYFMRLAGCFCFTFIVFI